MRRLRDLGPEQHETISGIVKPAFARQFGAGGYVGRASSRAFDARRMPGYAPYGDLTFEVDANAAGAAEP